MLGLLVVGEEVEAELLDAQLGLFFGYPWRTGEIVVTTGDVVIDFDTSGVPEERGPVFGFAKPASFEQGSRHGVFRFDAPREHVVDYLQKAPPDVLARSARIEGTGECALDIGLVSLSPAAALAFLELGSTSLEPATLLDGLAHGRLRFDLYLEVLTACVPPGGLSRFDTTTRLSRNRSIGFRMGVNSNADPVVVGVQ